MNISGAILSGGLSSRMGKSKAFLQLGGQTVIEHVSAVIKNCDEWFVVANDRHAHTFLKCPVYKDAYTYEGPLAGIEAALSYCQNDVCVLAPCDAPLVDWRVYQTLLNHMSDHDAIIPLFNDRMHPLSGVYRKSALPVIREQLANDQRKIRDIFNYIDVQYVSDYPGIPQPVVEKHFFNMNTPLEYEQALSMFKL